MNYRINSWSVQRYKDATKEQLEMRLVEIRRHIVLEKFTGIKREGLPLEHVEHNCLRALAGEFHKIK